MSNTENIESVQQFEIPEDVQKILDTNYEIPQYMEAEQEDGDEISLQNIQRPIISTMPVQVVDQPDEKLVNNETIEDYMKNMLSQLGLVKTLNQFQSEYLEMSKSAGSSRFQKLNQTNSQLLQENMSLKFQIDQLTLQNDKIIAAANKAKDQFTKLRSQRDFHRTKHRQVVQEKAVLVNDLRRLREHCQLYQPLIMELNARYDKLLRQKQLSDISRDKAQNELKKLQLNQPQTGTQQIDDKTIKKSMTTPQALAPITSHFRQSYSNPYVEPGHPLAATNSKFTLLATQQKVHEAALTSISFHRNLAVTATASTDGSFKVLTNFNSPQAHQLMVRGQPHNSFITCARFCPSASFQSIIASCAGDGTTKLFDVTSQSEVCGLKSVPNIQNWWLDWHCDGQVLAVASSDKAVRLYDLNLNEVIQQLNTKEELPSFMSLRGAQRSITQVAWAAFGNLLVSSGADGVARVYDVRANTVVSQIKMNNSCRAVFDVTAGLVGVGDLSGSFVVQDLRAMRPLFKAELESPITALSFDNKADALLGTKKGLFSYGQGAVKPVLRSETVSAECIDFCWQGSGGFGVGCTDGQLVYV